MMMAYLFFYSQTKIERAKFFVDTENAKSEEILLDNKKQVYYINGKVYQDRKSTRLNSVTT